MWCCGSAHGTAVLFNGLNTVYFICQQVLWLKAWDASLLFLLSLSFCAVSSLFQLCVCARTIWHGSAARQRVLLSRGKIINHNLDGEGVRDGFYFHFRADVPQVGSSSGEVSEQPLQRCLVGVWGREPRGGAGGSGPGGSALQSLTAVLLQEPLGAQDHLLQHCWAPERCPWIKIHFPGLCSILPGLVITDCQF